MPQIAQEDYIRIVPIIAELVTDDAYALAEIKRQVQRGTIYDCIIVSPRLERHEGRVVSLYSGGTGVFFISGETGEVVSVELVNTVTQYEGIGAVQQALADDGYDVDELPEFWTYNDNLIDNPSGYAITDENGNFVKVTSADGKITALERTTTKPSEGTDFVKVEFSELLKLIGLPIQ